MPWDTVLYHPDWRYLDSPKGRYVVRRRKKRSREWIITFNGEVLSRTFSSRDLAQKWVDSYLQSGGPFKEFE